MQHTLPTGRSRQARRGETATAKLSPRLPDHQLGAPALTLGELFDEPTPRQLRRLLFQSQLSVDLSKRRVMLSFAAELLGDIQDGGGNPASLLSDLHAELDLMRGLLHLAQGRVAQADAHLCSALAAAEDGTGDVILLGQIHEAVAQLVWLTDGAEEAEMQLRPALDLYRQAEQQPELASAWFRAAAWRLEGDELQLGLAHLRSALASLALETPLAAARSGAWEALRRLVGGAERFEGPWGPLCFAVAQELTAVELAEPLRRRVQGEAWALAALATLERGADAASAGKMLARAEHCLVRDDSVSRQRFEAVAVAFRHRIGEPEQPALVAETLAWANAVLTAAAEPERSPASLWSSAIADSDPHRAVFEALASG